VRLPYGPELTALDGTAVGSLDLVDHSAVDWQRVRSTAYLVRQLITYQYEGPVRRLRQRLVVQPRAHHGDQRRVMHRLEVLDATARRVTHRIDAFGNDVIDVSVPEVAERISFLSWSIVERHADQRLHLVDVAASADPRMLGATRLTAPDARLRSLASELRATGLVGRSLAVAASSRVHSEMRYAHDVTSVKTTAAEALALGQGVCQDYAHVLLVICRELGLPARYVSGQLLGDGGSHAWVEVLLPRGRRQVEVLALDPTHDRPAGLTYLTVAVGRDYADVAPLTGSYVATHAGFLTATKTVAVMDVVMRRARRALLIPATA